MIRPTRKQFIQKKRLMIDQLREQISNGMLQTNKFLPSEAQLAEQYGLSKESIRQALDELVDEGYITKVRRVGNRINDSSFWRSQEHAPQITLHFAHHGSLIRETPLQSFIDSFEQQHPGVRIQSIPTMFPIEYADHGMVDVITITAWDAMKRWSEPHRLSHLTSIEYNEAAHPKLYKAFQDPASKDGDKLIATPFLFSPIILCYNRAHFRQADISEPNDSWTWFTLLRSALAFKRKLNVCGFATPIQSINRWPVFLMQNNFQFRPDVPNWSASDDPALWGSLRVARDLMHKQGHSLPPWTDGGSDAEKLFLEGKVSMILTTYFGLNLFLQSDIDYGIAPLPMLANSNTMLISTGLSIVKGSDKQELARQFIRHLCSADSQTRIRRETVSLPAHAEALSVKDNLQGNRPAGESIYADMWDQCRHYSDLLLDANTLEAVRGELNSYWALLEDETEAGERLSMLLQ